MGKRPRATDTPSLQDFLESLEGVAYLTDTAGTIIAYGRRNWDRFARENGGDRLLDPQAVLGQPLLDFVAGEDVRESYRRHMAFVAKDGGRSSVFGFHCHAPGIERNMRMAITPFIRGGVMSGFLFHAVTLLATDRVPIDLYDFKARRAAAEAQAGLPFLGMCSYCQRVRFPAGSKEREGEWVEPTEYYRRGGTNEVTISHGICRTCYEAVMRDIEKDLDSSGSGTAPPA